MKRKLLLIGSGALARDIIEMFGVERFAGHYVDPRFASTANSRLPIFSDWSVARGAADHYVLALIDFEQRVRLGAEARAIGLTTSPCLVSERAVIASDAQIGRGTIIGHFSVVGPGARVGNEVLVMNSVQVAHDVTVDDHAVMATGATLGGHSRVGRGVFVGLNATVVPRVNIAAGSYIAAGASCHRDVDTAARLVGNPARQLPLNEQPQSNAS